MGVDAAYSIDSREARIKAMGGVEQGLARWVVRELWDGGKHRKRSEMIPQRWPRAQETPKSH